MIENKSKILIIYSGGQVGSDSAGLAAAYDLGIPTGGFAPKGWRTIYGPNPKLALLGLQECNSPNYKVRTWMNVKFSDGTIRLAYRFNSPGEKCTLEAIKEYDKPYLDINLKDLPFIFDVSDWIIKNNIYTLNIAGNAGNNKKESIEIFRIVRNYLKGVFLSIVYERNQNVNCS